jgi:hypothetical protein
MNQELSSLASFGRIIATATQLEMTSLFWFHHPQTARGSPCPKYKSEIRPIHVISASIQRYEDSKHGTNHYKYNIRCLLTNPYTKGNLNSITHAFSANLL